MYRFLDTVLFYTMSNIYFIEEIKKYFPKVRVFP